MSVKIIKSLYFKLPVIAKLLLVILFIMSLFGISIHLVEPEQFPTIFDGIWWAFVTAATVGYGDFVPLTIRGKIIGIFLILTGGGLIAFYITRFSAAAIRHQQNQTQGKAAFKGKGHLIFIGWNERTRQLLDITMDHEPEQRIVLIDRSLNHLAYQHYPVHFIHGDASEDETLAQANIEHAERVIITADLSEHERQADNYTILTTVAIRGNNHDLPIVAEILSKTQIENALRAGATTIIKSNDFMSTLLYHELRRTETAKPFEDILYLLKSQQFSHMKLPQELEEATFRHASNICLKDGRLLLGILRSDEWMINPGPDFLLQKEDMLITIRPWS
ncbi:potassium channel family protein [Lentibacillus sediminis]|uniref:potassium channel family protein n=1 Tax=Lentibacillus sediminis TaxID=1940529 RepID=UPI000C1BBF63|nr:potassium channel family protein [Lentibacillus sediminis]